MGTAQAAMYIVKIQKESFIIEAGKHVGPLDSPQNQMVPLNYREAPKVIIGDLHPVVTYLQQ